MGQVSFRGFKAFENAKLTGVLICSGAEFRNPQYAAVYYWHEHCRTHELPMILVVLASQTTATVTVNMNIASFMRFQPATHERLAPMVRDVCLSDSKRTARPFARIRERSLLIQGARRDKLQEFLNELIYMLYVDELHLERPIEAVSL